MSKQTIRAEFRDVLDGASICYLRFSILPRVGDKITLLSEGNSPKKYRVENIEWLVDLDDGGGDGSDCVILHCMGQRP